MSKTQATETNMTIGQVVRLTVPYSGCGTEDYNMGVITEVVSPRVVSLAPYRRTATCHGRAVTINTYHNRFVDFSLREVKAPEYAWPPRAL